MHRCFFKPFILLFIAITLGSCSFTTGNVSQSPKDASKIRFRLDNINTDGLRGPSVGLTSVAYEFCIPADNRKLQEVRQIDPNVQINHGSKGRIGCTSAQTLIIGNTSQPNWKQVLMKLSALPYITEIQEAFFE